MLITDMFALQVFPFEYQRALRQMAEEETATKAAAVNGGAESKAVVPTKPEPKVRDIEEAVSDVALEKKRLEKVLDKTR